MRLNEKHCDWKIFLKKIKPSLIHGPYFKNYCYQNFYLRLTIKEQKNLQCETLNLIQSTAWSLSKFATFAETNAGAINRH